MSRNFPDWISAYTTYAGVTEAPRRMHFWCGVSAIAGALRRRVWLDMKRYKVFCNFYVCLVAPPGVIAKSTSIDVAMKLLRRVPEVKFGPDTVTWPALVSAFAGASESFCYEDIWYPMSAITLEASELGSLLTPQDREQVALYITLWDGRDSYSKVTKHSGSDMVEAPWINMIAGTTPNWIADNMPRATIGGGLTSRMVFVFGDQKEKFIALVDEFVDPTDHTIADKLVADLEHIAQKVCGPFTITPAARAWERARYEHFWRVESLAMNSNLLEGYAARKQTHIFKTAMILSVSRGDSRQIEVEDLQLASKMLDDLEPDMQKVFSTIGRTDESLHAEQFIDFVRRKGQLPYMSAYRMTHLHFPNFRDFEGILTGAIQSGQLRLINTPNGMMLEATAPAPIVKEPTISPDTLL